MVSWIVPEFEHTDPSQVCVITNLLARTIEFRIDRLAHAIRARAAPSLAESTVLKGVKDFAVLCENGDADAHTVEISFNKVA